MSTAPKSGGESSKPAAGGSLNQKNPVMLILGLVGGVIVLAVGIFLVVQGIKISASILGSGSGGSKDPEAVGEMGEVLTAARSAAQSFLGHVSARRADSAYALTTRRYQDYKTDPEFKDLVEDAKVFHRHRDPSLEPRAGWTIHQVDFHGFVKGPNGSASFTLRMRLEEGEWKVDRFDIGK